MSHPASMQPRVFRSGPFAGVSVDDAFARAAMSESPVVVKLPPVVWPQNLAPVAQAFGGYPAGTPITGPADVAADFLIILYTEYEISAFLEVFTGDSSWTPARQKTWCPYAHNFAKFKGSIQGIDDNDALKSGYFGYLSLMTIGGTNVVLYKTELHPKANGPDLPFIPVIAQLIGELGPKLVISTGTAGGIGSVVNCGDVVITDAARLHVKMNYPSFPQINTLSNAHTQLASAANISDTYVQYATANFTKTSLPGLVQCYQKIGNRSGYSFLRENTAAPTIYLKGANSVPGPEPMDVVTADYLTVDDNNDSEGLQALGIMNETDDAFAFYAIGTLPTAQQPQWVSIRNASEPQVVVPAFPAGTSPTAIIDKLKGVAGAIYGVYQYCTTLNSALACWAVVAGM